MRKSSWPHGKKHSLHTLYAAFILSQSNTMRAPSECLPISTHHIHAEKKVRQRPRGLLLANMSSTISRLACIQLNLTAAIFGHTLTYTSTNLHLVERQAADLRHDRTWCSISAITEEPAFIQRSGVECNFTQQHGIVWLITVLARI